MIEATKCIREVQINKILKHLGDINSKNYCDNFLPAIKSTILKGCYPQILIEIWEEYKRKFENDEERQSINNHPTEYSNENQFYLALQFVLGGEELQNVKLENVNQALSIFCQTALALAVFEKQLNGEHRDLHNSNILLSPTDETTILFKIDGKEIIVKKGAVTFKNLECLVNQGNTAHWKCYNDMKKVLIETGDAKDSDEIWKRSNLKTNLIWLHYVSKELARKFGKKYNILNFMKIDKSCNSCSAYTSSANFKALCKKLE
uniref:Non-specific serine/threonine protein kinase n=1 Tax=Panagrolaimus davidi TaxID=227884 RepID=A0A914QVB4_9BILA